MVLSSYEPGTLCWAKLKGYPWWPSRIEREADLSDEVIDSKPRSGRFYPVLFYGSLDYAWITPENLEPYDQNLAKYGSKAKNRKDPSFADALKQAQDPSLAEEIMRRSAAINATDSDEDEDEDAEMASADETELRRSAKRKQSTTSRARRNSTSKRAASGTKRSGAATSAAAGGNMEAVSDAEDDAAAAMSTPKRPRTSSRATSKIGSESPMDTSNGNGSSDHDDTKHSPSSRQTPEPHGGSRNRSGSHSASKEDGRSDRSGKGHPRAKERGKAYHLLMQLRHRLQKTIIKGSVPDDLSQVNEVFKKLEDFDMTLELIQETKMGKVMRIIGGSDRLPDAPEDKYDFKGRARRLAEKWRQLIVKRREGSLEPSAPESPSPVRKTSAPVSELGGAGEEPRKTAEKTSNLEAAAAPEARDPKADDAEPSASAVAATNGSS
ncbi:hypothetical protein EC988_000956 [Linderina pennispora]|nr:hypothetical protein EC988_000956 [Linderina pennispora]